MPLTEVERFFAKRCSEILRIKSSVQIEKKSAQLRFKLNNVNPEMVIFGSKQGRRNFWVTDVAAIRRGSKNLENTVFCAKRRLFRMGAKEESV